MVPGKEKAGGTSKGGKGKSAAKGSRKGKGKGKSKTKPKDRLTRAARKAKDKGAALVNPNVGVVAKDPMRVQILAIAIQRPISPSEFAKEMGYKLGVVSYNFKVLREHGFLEVIDEVKVRGAVRHMHIATKSGFISDSDWGDVADVLRPGVAGAILQDFNGRVSQAIETRTLFERDDACLFWAPRDLDEIAWLEHVKMVAWCIEESKRHEVETVERRANGEDGGKNFCVTFAIAGFPSPTAAQVKAHAKRKQKLKAKRKKA